MDIIYTDYVLTDATCQVSTFKSWVLETFFMFFFYGITGYWNRGHHITLLCDQALRL